MDNFQQQTLRQNLVLFQRIVKVEVSPQFQQKQVGSDSLRGILAVNKQGREGG